MKKSHFILIVLFLGILGGIGLYFFSHHTLSEKDLKSATLLKQPRKLQSFSLVDMNKKIFTEESLKGEWNLIFFGFTSCPSICPTTLATLNQAYKKLSEFGIKKMPRVIFVSVDPEKDTPAILSKYLVHFNPNFLGVTGKEDQIEHFSKDLGAVYMEVKEENGNSQIDHSASVFVISPRGEFYALFSAPNNAQDVAVDLKKMIKG